MLSLAKRLRLSPQLVDRARTFGKRMKTLPGRLLVLWKARPERKWYKRAQMMTSAEIERAIAEDRLVRVDSIPDLLQVVPKNGLEGVQYPFLTRQSKALLEEIVHEFKNRITRQGFDLFFCA